MQVASKLRSVLNACGQTGCWEERQGRKKKEKESGELRLTNRTAKIKTPFEPEGKKLKKERKMQTKKSTSKMVSTKETPTSAIKEVEKEKRTKEE